MLYPRVTSRLSARSITIIISSSTRLRSNSPETRPPLKKRVVAAAIDQMPAQRKKIYRMSREAGRTTEEIAAELGVAKSTVHNTITTALNEIREQLTRAGFHLPLFVYLLIRIF